MDFYVYFTTIFKNLFLGGSGRGVGFVLLKVFGDIFLKKPIIWCDENYEGKQNFPYYLLAY